MRLSIIIPVYNVEPYIKVALDSVFRTSASSDDYEVIVVNDGTKDNSMTIVQQYKDRPNLQIYEQENRGLSAARMAGLENASGDYVWFIDSDDWIIENGVGIALRLLADHSDTDVLIFPLMRIFDDSSKNHLDYHIEKDKLTDGKTIIKENSIPLYSAVRYIIKRSLTSSRFLFFPIGLIHEDDYFGPILMCLATKIWVFSSALYIHPQREGSIMTTLTIQSSYDFVSIHQLLMTYMKQELMVDEWPWFRKYCWSRLWASFLSSFTRFRGTKDYNRFIRNKGLYFWNQWRTTFPFCPIRKQIRKFCFFCLPYTFTHLSIIKNRGQRMFQRNGSD